MARRWCSVAAAAAAAAADDDEKIVINYLWPDVKIRHGAIVDNVVFNLYAKFNDDRQWNEKAWVLLISDNNKNSNRAYATLK